MTNEQDTQPQAEESASLAREWVDHLKEKTRKLTLMLIVLGASVVGMMVMLVIVYSKNTELNDVVAQQSEQVKGLEEQRDVSVKTIEQLKTELQKSEQAKNFLEQLKGDTASQLSVAQKIIDTQKQKIQLIESEFEAQKGLVAELESSLSATRKSLDGVRVKNKSLAKDVAERKSAYVALVKRQKESRGEIDRLANALARAESMNAEQKEKLSIKSQSIANLKAKINDLEQAVAQGVATPLQQQSGSDVPTVSVPDKPVSKHHSLAVQPIIAQPDEKTKTKKEDPSAGVQVISSEQIVID